MADYGYDHLDASTYVTRDSPRVSIEMAKRKRDKSTIVAATMVDGMRRPWPKDIEYLLEKGQVVDVEQTFKDSRYVVKIDWSELDKIFNELGVMLNSDDVAFTAEDQEKLCESFLVLTNMMAMARTKTLARFGDD